MAQPEMVVAEGNFLVPNATFFAELLAFLIILFILGKYVVPPLQKALQDRQEMIRKQVEEADATRAKLAEAETGYATALREASTVAAQIRDDARADAAAIREELLAKAHEEADRVIALGREQLLAERAAIVRELRTEIGSLAVELAGRIVGESLEDESRQRRTVDRFLGELDRVSVAGGGS
jgi:F-type H+-transporting ATPase subunit b